MAKVGNPDIGKVGRHFEKGNKAACSFNGQLKKLKKANPNAKDDIYSILFVALSLGSKEQAAEYIAKASQEQPKYGFVLQLACKELLGKNGWKALNDILDRLYGRARQTISNEITTPQEGGVIRIVDTRKE